jgi:hypothetical protein
MVHCRETNFRISVIRSNQSRNQLFSIVCSAATATVAQAGARPHGGQTSLHTTTQSYLNLKSHWEFAHAPPRHVIEDGGRPGPGGNRRTHRQILAAAK